MSAHLQNINQESAVVFSGDATALHATVWAVGEPRGALLIAHGVGEHGGCYAEFVSALQSAMPEMEVVALDFRGHGRSPGRRGYVSHYEDLIGDLRSTLRWLHDRRPGLPIFVLGHSNGGQVAMRLALSHQDDMAGIIISNPASRLVFRVPPWKLWLGRVLHKVAPQVTLRGTLKPELLTRDRSQYAGRLEDPLRHGRVSAPLFFGMIEGGARLAEQVERLEVPLLLILGTADPIIDPEATRGIYEKVGSSDKQAHFYAESLHEPLNDLDRDRVISDVVDWLRNRLPR